MILEVDEETRDFVTIYKKDYDPKRSRKLQKCVLSPDYNPPLNPLNGPFHEHLSFLKKDELLSSEERTEDIRDNLKKVRAKYRHLQKILPETSPDPEVIETEQKKSFKTIYQLEYSKNLDDYHSLYAQRTGGDGRSGSLPDDWIIPETITNRSYRDPRNFSKSKIFSGGKKIIKPTNNLKPNDKEREIRRITTGNSTYEDVIGRTGDRIFREQLHGVPVPLDPISSRLNDPDAISSECHLMTRKTPFISNVIF